MLAQLRSVSVATLSVQLRQRGYDDASIDGVAPLRPGARFAGTARTLRYVPFRPDLFAEHGGGFNAQKRLFDAVGPGEVIVIEARGDASAGTVGDVLALRAQVRGAAGIVTDGAVRDADVVGALDIPTFARGAHPAVLGRRHIPWETDVTIACGGTTVQPGDVIVGDGDGVVVIPPALVAEVAAAAVEQEREEEFIAEQVRRRRVGRRVVPDERRVARDSTRRGIEEGEEVTALSKSRNWRTTTFASASTTAGSSPATGWCSAPSPRSSASASCRCARRSGCWRPRGS